MSYSAIACKCQECNEMFLVRQLMTTVIDLDTHDANLFFEHNVNKVICKNCSAEFTFELPMVIFSRKAKFAIRVSPTLDPDLCTEKFDAPYLLTCSEYKFRIVTYQIEAIEKAKIFMANLDDRYIEYIKLCSFSDAQATPFNTFNIIFDSIDDKNFYFKRYDSNNNVIDKYTVPISSLDESDIKYTDYDFHKYWNQINRFSVKSYIEPGGK